METAKKSVGSKIIGPFVVIIHLIQKISHIFTRRFTNKLRFKVEEIVCYSVHPSFYLWALIAFGWIISPFLNHLHSYVIGLTWFYIWVLFYTFIMLMFDIGTLKLVVCSGVFALIVISAKYIEAVQHIAILSDVINHFRMLHPSMNGSVAGVISWLLFFPWALSLIESFRSGRKSFSPNGIEERNLLVGREITDRAGLHFVCKYPDLLETILGFGSGSLIACNSDNKVVKEWHNIVGLYFKWDRLDEILHQRSAVVDNAKSDPVEVEDVLGTKK